MDLLAAYDPYVIFSVSVSLVIVLFIAILFLMRDPYNVAPHPVSRRVWCASRRHSADVTFVESVVTGMVRRSVQGCSLRDAGGSCDAACCYEPVDQMLPARPQTPVRRTVDRHVRLMHGGRGYGAGR